MKREENKLITNIENEVYHSNDGYFSSSSLKLFLFDREAFYKKYILKEKTETTFAAQVFGSYVHALILEPETVKDNYVVSDLSSRRGNAYKELNASTGNKTVILTMQNAKAQAMVEAVRKNKWAPSFITGGKAEASFYTQLNDFPIKVRADYIIVNDKEVIVVDLKTTGDGCDKMSVMRTCGRYSYDLSAALYVDAFSQGFKQKVSFYFIFIGKEPVDVAIYKASKEFLDNGRRKYLVAISGLKQAIKEDKYFSDEIQEITVLPGDIYGK